MPAETPGPAGNSSIEPKSDFEQNFGHLNAEQLRQSIAGIKIGKKSIIFGSAGAGLAALIIGAALILLPLKIEAIMKNIAEKRVTDKVDHLIERRADKMVVRYFFDKAGATTGSGIYADASIVKTLYGNWRLGKFEKSFSDGTGYKLEKAGRSGIRLIPPEGGARTFAGADALEQYIGTNKGIDARRLIRVVTRQQTKWYQIIQRRNLRIFMRNAYGIRKWTFFTGKKGPEADVEVSARLRDSAMEPYAEEAPKVLGCATEGNDCASDTTGDPDNPYGRAQGDAPTSATGGDNGGLPGDTADSIQAAEDTVSKYKPGQLVQKGVEQILSKVISEELSKKIAAKVVPVTGQILMIDMAARVDHFFRSGGADRTLRTVHKVQYATLFANWQIIDSNTRDNKKQMSGEEFNAVMKKLDGVGKGAAFQDLFLNHSGGTTIKPELGINDTATPVKDAYVNGSVVAIGITGPLQAWYLAVDTTPLKYLIEVINTVGGELGKLFGLIPGLNELASGLGGKLTSTFMALIRPAVDGTEVGDPLVNAIDAGGAVTGQDFAANLGGHDLSRRASIELQDSIALDKAALRPGLMTRLFSPDYSQSAVNQIAMALPSGPSAAINQTADYTLAVIHNPFNLFGALSHAFTSNAEARAGRNLYGLKDKGFTEAELSQPVAESVDHLNEATQNAATRLNMTFEEVSKDPSLIEMADCPKVGEGQANMCRLDLASIQSLNSVYTTNDDGGIGAGDNTSTPNDSGTGSGTGNFAWPVGKQYPVTSCWKAVRPGHLHAGLDVGVPNGTPIKALDDGTVEIADGTTDPGGYGNVVLINHGNGKWSLYGHLSQITVKKGQKVSQGDVVGKSGNSGDSPAYHLHFNMQDKGGLLGNAANPGTLNPLDYLPTDGRSLVTGNGTCIKGPLGHT